MKLIRWFIVVVIVSAVVGGLFYYKASLSGGQKMQSGPEPSAKVQAFRAQGVTYQKQISVIGEGQAVKYITLKNELAGKVSKLNMASGDRVKKGQVLVELDHSEELASLASAKATMKLKKRTLQRYITLEKASRISKESVDLAQAEYSIAIADTTRLEAIIAKKIITAPFDASVGIHNINLGQFLDKNADITDLLGLENYIWVDFKVPQSYAQLPVNSSVEITVNADAASTGISSEAMISSVASLYSQDSRQLKYRAKVFNSALDIKANQLVKVALPIMPAQSVITVPNLAIVRDQLGDYVFKLIKDEQGDYRASREKIVLGDRIDEQVIVIKGLKVDDLIAAKGAFKLRQGLKTYFDQDNLGG
ncbi:efflux RND transporter periplasmic adaptor subunit [Colwellia sp. MB02u-9]|uniref:efflux RND transporter periplasmic adaptor subunit n=1 Tax=Colwellia sp. MB02u-9 TaxID=2759823 RepID=UPI0015F6100A|nr:efflux RND transporter periplasmic adaptor subunit [Colwellia sp. MB02u-9]MBA6297361.1 efflux RND transporter periplasmic adaptor subunit [Colwellia sp. MB02u-9]